MIRRTVALLASSKGLFAVAVASGAFCGLALSFGGSSHTVVAQFTNVNGLVKDNEVRIGGVEAGTVQDLQATVDPKTGAQYAEVTLTVDNAHWPLHQGTRVAVRPKGVLSNVYVDLEPGSTGSPVLGDAPVFTTDVTSSPVNLDELSNVFDPSVRASIRTQLQEGVIAFGGTGVGALNTTLGNLNPLTADAIPVTSVLAARTPELDRLTTEFDTISGNLAREDANLGGLISNGNIFLGVLAAHEASLQGTLVHAAGTLTTLDNSLRGEEANLATIFQKGPTALNEAKSAADLLTPLIAAVNPHVANLDVLLNEFLTATGYNQGNPQGRGGKAIDTLRVDGTLPPSNRSATPSCGYTAEQKGCPG